MKLTLEQTKYVFEALESYEWGRGPFEGEKLDMHQQCWVKLQAQIRDLEENQ